MSKVIEIVDKRSLAHNVVKLETYEKSEAEVTETSMHHLACAMCDNEKCVRGTKECEFEQWKAKQEKGGY